jgi:hypothetical protein
MAAPDPAWQPRRIVRVVEAFPTASSVVRVETDQGEGFLKALGNAAGPHSLACEFVGTRLARRLGLPTLTLALMNVTGELPIPLGNGQMALPGPAFITRVEDGAPWGGDAEDLKRLDNAADLARLVVFDTWTRNCDRYMPREGGPRINRDNVFLSRQGAPAGRFVLKAIDHGHCFDHRPELTVRLADIECVRDDRVYGLFPEFVGLVDRESLLRAVEDVQAIPRAEVEALLRDVPREWEVRDAVTEAWCNLICQRATYIRQIVDRHWPRQSLFDPSPGQEGQP